MCQTTTNGFSALIAPLIVIRLSVKKKEILRKENLKEILTVSTFSSDGVKTSSLFSLVLGLPAAPVRSSRRSVFKMRRQWANEKTNNHHTSGDKHGGYVMPVLFIADNRRRGLFKRKRIPRNLEILTSSFTYDVTVLIFEREKSPRVPLTVV